MITLTHLYKRFPTGSDCISHLESIIWDNEPVCPYCKSNRNTPLKNEDRYHCNSCNISYSVTTNTLMHRSRVDLQKWFYTIALFYSQKDNFSARDLAREIVVTKDSAWLMLKKMKSTYIKDGEFLKRIYNSLIQ